MAASARLRHLSALTTVLHRCLGEGDIARAKRAFGMLTRAQDVDIRRGGLWAVGAEISVCSPVAIAGHACFWTSVGPSKAPSNQLRTAGVKASRATRPA